MEQARPWVKSARKVIGPLREFWTVVDDCLDLESNPMLVTAARAFVQSRLDSWEASEVASDAALVTSELVTNAVLHARTEIHLRVTTNGSKVRIEVYDANSRLPNVAPCGLDVTNGRGLAVVAALASSWGVEQHANGKMVWAELDVPFRRADDCLDLTVMASGRRVRKTLTRPGRPHQHPDATDGLRAAEEVLVTDGFGRGHGGGEAVPQPPVRHQRDH